MFVKKTSTSQPRAALSFRRRYSFQNAKRPSSGHHHVARVRRHQISRPRTDRRGLCRGGVLGAGCMTITTLAIAVAVNASNPGAFLALPWSDMI